MCHRLFPPRWFPLAEGLSEQWLPQRNPNRVPFGKPPTVRLRVGNRWLTLPAPLFTKTNNANRRSYQLITPFWNTASDAVEGVRVSEPVTYGLRGLLRPEDGKPEANDVSRQYAGKSPGFFRPIETLTMMITITQPLKSDLVERLHQDNLQLAGRCGR